MPLTYFDKNGIHKNATTKEPINSGLKLTEEQLAKRKEGYGFYAKQKSGGAWEMKMSKLNRSGRKKGSMGKRKRSKHSADEAGKKKKKSKKSKKFSLTDMIPPSM